MLTGSALGQDVCRGPCIVASGPDDAWIHIKGPLENAAMRHGDSSCCAWVGKAGAAHYVHRSHESLASAVLQLIGEVVHVMVRDTSSSRSYRV